MESKLIYNSSLESWKAIGVGGFGQIFKARYKCWNVDVAVKVLHHNNSLAFQKEAHLMREADSPFVVKIFGEYKGIPPCIKTIVDLQGLVMEYMERGSLDSLLTHLGGPPPWPLAFRLAHQVAIGMNFLHSLNPQLLHLDLKPSNILLNNSLDAKITDFGLAKILRSTSSHTIEEEGGTISYMPPEAFDLSYQPTPASDVYSYAILLCSIIKGDQPYPNNITSVVKFRIPKGDRPNLDEVDLSKAKGLKELVNLIRSCWHNDPLSRPSFFDCVKKTERLLEPHKYEINDAVHKVVESLDSEMRKTEQQLDSLSISSSVQSTWGGPSTSNHVMGNQAPLQDRPGNSSPKLTAKGHNPARAQSMDPKMTSPIHLPQTAFPSSQSPGFHRKDMGPTPVHASVSYPDPLNLPAASPSPVPLGTVNISVSNVYGVQIGNGNTMVINGSRHPRRRNPTAPS